VKDWLFLTYPDYKGADPVEGLTTINRGNIDDPRLRQILRNKNGAGAGEGRGRCLSLMLRTGQKGGCNH
jgi:hypothetical protein